MSRVATAGRSVNHARTLLREGARRLVAASLPRAAHEAEWLLAHLLGTRTLDLYLDDPVVPEPSAAKFLAQVEARASGVPAQYLTGEAEFFGRPFAVEPGVFIPRPETEAVTEAAIRALQTARSTPRRLADLGTGSGCITVTLANAFPACVVVGVELSWEALCVAARNVRRHGLAGRVHLVHGSWTEPLAAGWDGIVANPPYVPHAQLERLPTEVRYEPPESLDGGDDGLRELWRLLAETPRILRPGGLLVLECGEEQVEPLLARARNGPWAMGTPLQDLAGRPRGVLLTRWTTPAAEIRP